MPEHITDLDKMIQKFRTLSEVHTVNSESLQYAQICAWLLELKHKRSSSSVKNTKSNLHKNTKSNLHKKTEESFSLLQDLCSVLELNSLSQRLSGTKEFIIRMINYSNLPEV